MKPRIYSTALSFLFLLALLGATARVSAAPQIQSPALVFAAIGDYGLAGPAEEAVANLVKSWNPAFILTLGDNNYPNGASYSLESNIGRYYSDYIFRYQGKYGSGSPTRRFFPALGNHDWHQGSANPYLNYFDLPGNERYYHFVQGPVHFFVLDSVEYEPDGVDPASGQAAWLRQKMAASTSPFNVVVTHYPPYSSGKHGSVPFMQWQFKEWGADLVLAGHNHVYERLSVNGLTYIVNGLGGDYLGNFRAEILPESLVRYNAQHGALRLEATDDYLKVQFISIDNALIDEYVIGSSSVPPRAVSISRISPLNAPVPEFHVKFSEPVSGVDVTDFVLHATGINGAYVSEVTGAGADYVARVNVGQSAGSLRLDLIDDDSVLNAYGVPLGGAGWGNGGLSSETYLADSLPPFVVSITRSGVSPTRADVVDFNVKFSEPVAGVDSSDFAVSAAGISGAFIANLIGGGDSYLVSVNAGAGDGELRLDLLNNFSVLDAAGNPLANALAGESYTIQKSVPVVLSIARLGAALTNSNDAYFSVVFSEPVTGVDSSDFALRAAGINGAYVSAVGGEGANYFISVQTGTGDGSLRLDLLDDDSVLNLAGIPLGGIGAGNANFASGESYALDKTPPVVVSILRASPNPTSAGSADFVVAFSEPVFGVDSSDFQLMTEGVGGASIAEVKNAGASSLVSVWTGAGGGSLRLDLADDNSVLDAAGNPLGGFGLGDGNFASGEAYQVFKAPVVLKETPIPALISPARGALLNALAPALSWTKAPGAAYYEVFVARDAAFQQVVFDFFVNENQIMLALPGDGTYFWQVRACDSNRNAGRFSAASSFTIDATPPPAPTLLSPSNNARLSARWKFVWSDVGAARYEIQIDDSPDFSSPAWSSLRRDPFYSVSAMRKGIYFWRVRAKDEAGNWSAWSAVFQLTVP